MGPGKCSGKTKTALSGDKVCILINILVEDNWVFVFRGAKIDNRTYRLIMELDWSVFLFKTMISGSHTVNTDWYNSTWSLYNFYGW